MKSIIYSHNFGEYAVPDDERISIIECISQANFTLRNLKSSNLRKYLIDELMKLGWSDKVKIDSKSNVTITSMKNRIGLCLQTGNVGRFYADILKLQTLFQKDKARCAIYIIPTKELAVKLGDNIACFERFIDELKIYKHIISMPILIIGIY